MGFGEVMLPESGCWVPVTPEKLVAETGAFSKSLSPDPDVALDQKKHHRFPQNGGFESVLHRSAVSDSEMASGKASGKGKTKKPRMKMKRHRPKVFDETKPRRKPTTCKVKIQKNNAKHSPTTPSSRTPKRALSPKTDSFKSCIDDEKEVNQGFFVEHSCRRALVFSSSDDISLDQKSSDILLDSVAQSQPHDESSCFRVYQRRRKDDCLWNNRKLGLNFPKMCKRSRMKRRKATAFAKFIVEGNELSGSLRMLVPELGTICKKKRTKRRKRGQLKSSGSSTQNLSSSVSLKRKRSKIRTRRRDLSSFAVSGSFLQNLRSPKTYCDKIDACLEVQNQIMDQLTTKQFSGNNQIPLDDESSQNQPTWRDLLPCFQENLRQKSMEKFSDSTLLRPYYRRHRHEQMNVPSQEKDETIKAFVDYAVKKMESLQINDRNRQLAIHVKDPNNQIVVKNQDAFGLIVPVAKNNLSKTRKTLPKVDLDAETVRIWNLLMEKGDSEYTEPEEDGKARYWKEQRKIFDGRIDSFIARMHLIQGDRRFSPWKGSVVDSVVGVYLTQNVSDHLSSSAFMNLASRFPPPLQEHCEDETQNNSSIPETELIRLSETNYEEVSTSAEACLSLSVGMKEKKSQESTIVWDELRKKYSQGRERTSWNMDSVHWEAVRKTPVLELAHIIEKRGMHNMLAGKIKDFLDRIVRDHGSIDLEWLRDVPPDKAKEYLLSIYGIGLKSVECVRLLTLHHHAFPVDTNVGRILVRLGWVPLQPLPGDLQIHLLNDYPMLDTVQKYIWPRLCHMDQTKLLQLFDASSLSEGVLDLSTCNCSCVLHYQMITFAKVFCTKSKPNCNACPMRAECRHFASAFASSRLSLGGPARTTEPESSRQDSSTGGAIEPVCSSTTVECEKNPQKCGSISEPIIEFPPSPPPEEPQPAAAAAAAIRETDIEDFPFDRDGGETKRGACDSDDETLITTIELNGEEEEISRNLMPFVRDGGAIFSSKDLICLSPESASIPLPKMKQKGRLRTVHRVYEIPDCNPILRGFARREKDDPCPYLLAVWPSGESTETDSFSKQMVLHEDDDLSVKGTILIPCRTANRGSFPLNGTYFQVNEVFADHESSREPISVPRVWIWNLNQRPLFCGTSVSAICRGFRIQEIGLCFRRGFVCVRGIDRATGSPRPLSPRFHINTMMEDS